MTDEYVLKAREMLAVELEKQYCPTTAGSYRNGDYDDAFETAVLARVLREQPPQPTFEQRVEAMRRTYLGFYKTYEAATEAYDAALAGIMAPKVDPLVEAMSELDWCNPEALASDLRKALAPRGITIPETLP